MSEERKAEIDRRVDFSFYQQYLQSEVDWLESCAWGHEGVDCECKEIVKEMREQREKWWQETLKKRRQASEEIVNKVEEVPEKEIGPSAETVSEVKETPEEGTGPSATEDVEKSWEENILGVICRVCSREFPSRLLAAHHVHADHDVHGGDEDRVKDAENMVTSGLLLCIIGPRQL
jgi:hypothetical protein